MESGQNDQVPLPTKKTTSTGVWLAEQGGRDEVVAQMEEALRIANGNYLGVDDQIAISTSEILLLVAQQKDDLSAASFFDNKRFEEERIEAIKTGFEKESIGSEAGVWGYRFSILPTDPLEVVAGVKNGLRDARDENMVRLQRIYSENKEEATYSFGDRLKPENLMHWRNLVANHKAGNTQEVKEWDNVFDLEKGILPRDSDKRGLSNLFGVVVFNENDKDFNRDFGKLIEDKKVAKVILFKNSDGKIDKVETWFPHFTCDEAEGRTVLELIGARLLPDGEDNIGTNFLRNYQMVDKDGKVVNIFDVETNFRMTKTEMELHHDAAITIGISRPAYLATGALACGKESSAYICAGPDIPRNPNEPIASGLQFALMTSNYEIKNLQNSLSGVGWDNVPRIVNMVNQDIFNRSVAKKFILALGNIGRFTNAEIKKAKKALSTLSILGTYLPEISRKIFKAGFNRQHKLISEGAFQVSAVDHKKSKIQNATFITATNLSTDTVLSAKRDETGLMCDLRFVTDRSMQEEAEKRLGARGLNDINISDYKKEIAKIVEERQLLFRRTLVFMSLMILHDDVKNRPGLIKDRPLNDLYNRVSKAFNEIGQENLPKT